MGRVRYEEGFERASRLRDNGKVAEAVLLYQDIATLSLEENNSSQAAEALHMAGNAMKMTIGPGEQSKFRSASEFFSRAYALFDSLGDAVSRGAVLRDIGVAADKVGNYAIALESFQRSLELLSETEAPAQLAITYDKLGVHFVRTGQAKQALPYMEKALDLLRQEPTSGFFRATTLLDRAIAYLTAGNVQAALGDAEEALGWFEADHGGPTYNVRRAESAALLALVHEQLGEVKQSRRYLNQSTRLLKSFDNEVAARLKAEIEEWARAL